MRLPSQSMTGDTGPVAAREQVIVAGAGIVGSVTALVLAAQGIPVTLIDPAVDPSEDERGAILHPATLDLLEASGVTAFLLEHGTLCPTLQYREHANGPITEFDLAGLANEMRHPYRVLFRRAALIRFLHDAVRAAPGARVLLSCCPLRLRQNDWHVELVVQLPQGVATLIGAYLIGAEDELSGVRALLGVPQDILAPPARFVSSTIEFDFRAALGDVRPITYFADHSAWSLLVQRRGQWEMLYPVPRDMSDMEAVDAKTIVAQLARIARGAVQAPILSRRIETAGRAIARTYGLGRVFLAGDAAHQLDPVDDLGLNCGITDAIELAGRLADVWHGLSPPRILDDYELHRRRAAAMAIKTALQHYKLLSIPPPTFRQRVARTWQRFAGDKSEPRRTLLREAIVASLQRPAKIR